MGHKMLSWYPWVPIGGLMGINCAILTYNGTAFFGFTGDVHAAPDLLRLESFLRLSFAELRRAARGRAPRENKKRRSAKSSGRIDAGAGGHSSRVNAASSQSSFGRIGESTTSVN